MIFDLNDKRIDIMIRVIFFVCFLWFDKVFNENNYKYYFKRFESDFELGF